jgi:hypothetical protein
VVALYDVFVVAGELAPEALFQYVCRVPPSDVEFAENANYYAVSLVTMQRSFREQWVHTFLYPVPQWILAMQRQPLWGTSGFHELEFP